MTQFQEFLRNQGLKVKIFPENTATAAEAAKAIGCDVAQITKSLVFRTASGKPILVLCSGANRVDIQKLQKIVGEPVEKADADFSLEHTGFTIGGIPPFSHKEKMQTFIDEDLQKFPEVWAAAGTIRSVFRIDLADLEQRTEATPVDVRDQGQVG